MVSLSRLTAEVEEDGQLSRRRVVALTPESVPRHYTLTPGSTVGAISLDGLSIGIVPKAGVGKTAYMLAQGIGLAKWRSDTASYDATQSVADVLIPVFLSEVAQIVAKGLVEDYQVTSEQGGKPRGRIDFTFASRLGMPLPLRYEYDDLSADTRENQTLLHTLSLVGDLASLPASARGEARNLARDFADVSWVAFPQLLQYDELEELPTRVSHYRDALLLAGLIIRSVGLEPGGLRRSRAVLFDMNKVFETYVTRRLAALVPTGTEIDAQAAVRRLYLDTRRRIRLKPDFALWRGSSCAAVGDVKYKVLDHKHGPRQADLYQVAAYAIAASTTRALLIYVGSDSARRLTIMNSGVQVDVIALDVDAPPEEMESQLQDAAAKLALPAS